MKLAVPPGRTIVLERPTTTAIVSADKLSHTNSPDAPNGADEIEIIELPLELGLQPTR